MNFLDEAIWVSLESGQRRGMTTMYSAPNNTIV